MKKILAYIILLLLSTENICGQQADSLFVSNDSVRMKKHYFRAAIQALSVNASVWAYNRYIREADFAKISFHSIHDNIKKGLVWDNDLFSSNQLLHPFHGSFIYSSARCNGMSYWTSLSYTFAGSLSWEFCAETTPPSINDLITTTLGGAALGEGTYRISSLVLDDSKRGFNRFFRELLGTVISPSRGINRLLTGNAWKVRHKYYLYHDYEKIPVNCSLTVGDRLMADNGSLFKENNNMFVEFNMIYGNPFQNSTNKPFDYINFSSLINVGGKQPVIGSVNIAAKLYGKYSEPLPGHKMMIGLFQHFDYFDSGLVTKDSKKIPFKISEAAAIGVGMTYLLPATKKITIRYRGHLNAVLLGASLTDYYRLGRDYNLGSGYSIKSNTHIEFSKYGSFELNMFDYQIFTWRGYKPEDLKTKASPYLYLNTQGDKGNAELFLINAIMGININSKTKINLGSYYYFRNTHYAYHDDVISRTYEFRLGLKYKF
ncbi:DUF3943 domain-containing protein [Bacteroides sedimenti]|uniref:DUF3943 domain-containing protein n=1 Tax=Bacteroides sedimenti TaxID=2136147 RepID=A0ABN6Z9H8_9BACE